jgi:hypothetical protein
MTVGKMWVGSLRTHGDYLLLGGKAALACLGDGVYNCYYCTPIALIIQLTFVCLPDNQVSLLPQTKGATAAYL